MVVTCENSQMLPQRKEISAAPWQWLHQYGALVLSLLLVIPLLLLLATLKKRRSQGASATMGGRRLPPSPPKLPLIGNLHQVGSCPHRSLAALSQKHGPLMLLQLGQVPTLVVSSANMAEEIMKTHDVVFANRPQLEVAKQLFYGCQDLGFSPYGEHWKNLRRISGIHLLGPKKVKSYRRVREEEVAFVIEKIERLSSSCGVVDVSEILRDFGTDLVFRVIHGRWFRDRGLTKVFSELIEEHNTLLSRFHVGDYYPSLRWLSVLTGLDSMVRRTYQKWEHVLDSIIEDHLHRSKGNGELHQETFMEDLLALQKDSMAEPPLTTETIKALIIDMLAAGIETSYVALEWAMAELLRSSAAMKRAQAEVREVVGARPTVEEADIAQMNYLRAVIKETLRLHPPAPLLLPRLLSEDAHIGGYEIPNQTRVFINAWAIMRDPQFWEAPEEFQPERFLDTCVDFKGRNFQFIPFGAGRRICPGMQFASSVIELALANLLHRFDWELPDRMRGEDLNMDERFGVVTHRKQHLHVIPIPRVH